MERRHHFFYFRGSINSVHKVRRDTMNYSWQQADCLSVENAGSPWERAILNTPLFLLAVLFDFRLLVWWKQRYDYYLVTLTHIKRYEARCSGERNHYHTWGFPLGQINSESAVFRFTTSASQPRWRNMAVTERYSIKKPELSLIV